MNYAIDPVHTYFTLTLQNRATIAYPFCYLISLLLTGENLSQGVEDYFLISPHIQGQTIQKPGIHQIIGNVPSANKEEQTGLAYQHKYVHPKVFPISSSTLHMLIYKTHRHQRLLRWLMDCEIN